MNTLSNRAARWAGLAVTGLCLVTGCAALRPEPAPDSPGVYSFDTARRAAPIMTAARFAAAAMAPTLVVSVPRAVAGFDSRRLIYVRQPYQLEYFSSSEWIDTPARMLAPLVVAELERSGGFRAVVRAPGSASTDLRLETEVVLLQHEFGGTPSRVRLALRATLLDDASRRVIATHEFDAVADASSDNPYAGVVAANQAVRTVLEELATFCADAAKIWRHDNPSASQ